MFNSVTRELLELDVLGITDPYIGNASQDFSSRVLAQTASAKSNIQPFSFLKPALEGFATSCRIPAIH